MAGQIVYHLSPKSNKPVMPAIIVNVRQDADSISNGIVDLHCFHPNSSGTNIVYGVKFSDKEFEGTWWHLPSIEEHKVKVDHMAKSKIEVERKTELAFKNQAQADKAQYERRTK